MVGMKWLFVGMWNGNDNDTDGNIRYHADCCCCRKHQNPTCVLRNTVTRTDRVGLPF